MRRKWKQEWERDGNVGKRLRYIFVDCFFFTTLFLSISPSHPHPPHSVYSQRDEKSNNQEQKEFASRNMSAILHPAWQISSVDLWWLLLMNSIKSSLEGGCAHTCMSLTECGTDEMSDPTCHRIRLRNHSNQLRGFVASNVVCGFSQFCAYQVWCGKPTNPTIAQMIPQNNPMAHVIWNFFSSLLTTFSSYLQLGSIYCCAENRRKIITAVSSYAVLYHLSLNERHYKEL